jgi:hypothetical protein
VEKLNKTNIIHRLKYGVSRLDEIHTRLMEIAKEERQLLDERRSIQAQMFKSKMNLHINEIIDGIGHG